MAAAVDDVDDAFDADVEHDIGGAVECRRAIDEGEMVHLVDAAHGGIDCRGVADIAADELDVVSDLLQPAQGSAGIVVEHPHRLALTHQRLDQGRTDKAAAAGDQNMPWAHPCAVFAFSRRPHSTSMALAGHPDGGRTDGLKWDGLRRRPSAVISNEARPLRGIRLPYANVRILVRRDNRGQSP